MLQPDKSDTGVVHGPPTAEQWLRSLRNIRLTPRGRRAVELYREGVPEELIEAQLGQ